MTASAEEGAARLDIPFAEFVALVALLISITALSIDIMLPALPAIGAELDVVEENRRQAIVVVFFIGFGSGQLIFGPLADRLGRRPPLMAGLGLCAVAALICALTEDFEVLLAARCLQGVACAGPRVVVIAVVRDCFSGPAMARVMSLAMSVFIIVPVVAPTLGEAILQIAGWRWIFIFIAAMALALIVWSSLRLRETSAPENRLSLSPGRLARAFATVAATRQTIGYAAATGTLLGAFYAYLASAQQIYVGIYDLGSLFPLAWAAVAASMACAFYANSRLVMRLGTRRVSHCAASGMVVVTAVFAAVAGAGTPPLGAFMAAMACFVFLFGLMVPNFNAMAMEPQGRIAGTASSFLGCMTTVSGAALGWIVGQSFDGTLFPLAMGFSALSIISLTWVLLTERGRLFGIKQV